MQVVVNGARMVSKDKREWDDGNVSYSAKFSNGLGDLCNVTLGVEVWDALVPFDKSYDMELDVSTRGYRTYCDLVHITEA